MAGGKVLVGSDDRTLSAFSFENGRTAWRLRTGGAVESNPAVADGVVYFGSNDRKLYAVDLATGKLRWKFATGGPIGYGGSPVVHDGSVSFCSDDGFVYSVHVRTGEERWRFNVGGLFAAPVAYASGSLLAGAKNGSLFALDAASGRMRWKAGVGQGIYGIAVAGASLFVTSSPVPQPLPGGGYTVVTTGTLFSLDAGTGKERWRFVSARMFNSPAVAQGKVFVGTDAALIAVDAGSGKTLWSDSFGVGGVSSEPSVADGVVYFGSDVGNLEARDANTGAELWGIAADAAITTAPTPDGDWLYYIGDSLFAIHAG